MEVQHKNTNTPTTPTTILEAPMNILVPFASFYPKCLADLILGPNLDSAPWLKAFIVLTIRAKMIGGGRPLKRKFCNK